MLSKHRITVSACLVGVLFSASCLGAQIAQKTFHRTPLVNKSGRAANDLHIRFLSDQDQVPVLRRNDEQTNPPAITTYPAGRVDDEGQSGDTDDDAWGHWDSGGDLGAKDVGDGTTVWVDHEGNIDENNSYWTWNNEPISNGMGGEVRKYKSSPLLEWPYTNADTGQIDLQRPVVTLQNHEQVPVLFRDLRVFADNVLENFDVEQFHRPSGRTLDAVPSELLLQPGDRVQFPLFDQDPHDGYLLVSGSFEIHDWAPFSSDADLAQVPLGFVLASGWSRVDGETFPGDLNGDATVDASDAAMLFAAWGKSDSPADVNHDGWTDAGDASILFANWTGDALPTASVPEPACHVILMTMGLLWAVARRTVG